MTAVASRRPSNGDVDHGHDVTKIVDPEARIAMLKAQREKERDREIAMKEMQVKYVVQVLVHKSHFFVRSNKLSKLIVKIEDDQLKIVPKLLHLISI